MKKKIIAVIMVLLFSLAAAPSSEYLLIPVAAKQNEKKASVGYVHVSGERIVDGNNKNYTIKGMSFGNDVWSNPKTPVMTHHNEASYRELSKMGFNSVRFYLNYALFEDDKNPYKYKESGFDWLDKNIMWAKKNNIRLVLNMHYPQGGYQSGGDGLKLWTDKNNQKRLIALWGEIAKRYADEPYIIGYGLINEPVVPELDTAEKSIAQCSSLMQQITDRIRKYDKNHIIFAERVISVINLDGKPVKWENYTLDKMTFLLKDKNVVYEFHFYDPMSFTSQNASWAGTSGTASEYPSEQIAVNSWINAWVSMCPGKSVKEMSDGWTYFESDYISLSSKYNIGAAALQAMSLGKGGMALFDDITVCEYTASGNKIGNVVAINFDDRLPNSINMWSRDESGKCEPWVDCGVNNSGCMVVSDTTSDANITLAHFELKKGCKYKICGMVKTLNSSAEYIRPRIELSLSDDFASLNKAYVEQKLTELLEFGVKNKVPLYLGEFGVNAEGFKNNRGGEQWVADMLELCKKYKLSFNYHTFHEVGFGLYQSSSDKLPVKKNLNDKLAKVFEEELD